MSRISVAVLVAAALAAPAPAQVYVVGSDNSFGSFDLTTRVYTQISASIGTGGAYENLTSNGAGGFFTTFRPDATIDYQLNNLTTSGSVSTVGSTQSSLLIRGLARDSGGVVYAIKNNSGTAVGTINTGTGAFTSIGSPAITFGGSPGGALAFAGSTLFLTGRNNNVPTSHLYSVSTTNGAVTAINATSNATYTSMLAFSDGSQLYGINGTTLYTINTGDGSLGTGQAITNLGSLTGFTGAFYIAPVPEPGLVLGVAAAGLGLVRVVRRRKAAVGV